MRPIEWIVCDDTGISSKTIWAVMMGTEIDCADIPHDPADFGRCYRLLNLFPGWRWRLHEVSDKYPAWKPLVDNWDRLTALYEEEAPSGRCPTLYAAMDELRGRRFAAKATMLVKEEA